MPKSLNSSTFSIVCALTLISGQQCQVRVLRVIVSRLGKVIDNPELSSGNIISLLERTKDCHSVFGN